MTQFKTEQETFWAGNFGDEYSRRVGGEGLVAALTALHAQILRRTIGVKSILEFGANIGLNLTALRRLLPTVELSAIEINPVALRTLLDNPEIEKVTHSRFSNLSRTISETLFLSKVYLST